MSEHPEPCQPATAELACGIAVDVTDVPFAMIGPHRLPQSLAAAPRPRAPGVSLPRASREERVKSNGDQEPVT